MTIYNSHPAQCDLDWFAEHPHNFHIRLADAETTAAFREALAIHPAIRSKVYILSKRNGGAFTLMHSANLLNETQADCRRFWNDLTEDRDHRERSQQPTRPTPRVA